MAPDGDKIRVTARITKELDTKIHRYYTNTAPAIIEGLELLVSRREEKRSPNWHQSTIGGTNDLLALIGDKDKQIEFLKEQLAIKDSQLEKQAYSLQSLIQLNSALNMKLLPEKTSINAEEVTPLPTVKSREILLEEELAQPSQENLQSINAHKIKKETQAKPAKIIECANCGKTITAQRSTRKFCSGKCKTAYERKAKK